MQFEGYEIEQVLEQCDKIFTLQNVIQHVEIWNKRHAVSILKIIKDLFLDIEEEIIDCCSDSESDDEMSTNQCVFWNDIVNDKSFLSLVNSSEWNADSLVTSCNETDADAVPDIVNDILPSSMEM